MRTTLIQRALALALASSAAPALAQDPGNSSAFGRQIRLDGIDDYVWALPNAAGRVEGTIEMWVQVDLMSPSTAFWTGGNGHVGTNGEYTRLGTHSSANGVSFGVYTAGWNWVGSTLANLPEGWNHLAGTWGPAGLRLYINGTPYGSPGYAGPMPSYLLELIGASSWGSHYTGAVDEVRVWSVARSELELQTAMGDTLDLAVYGVPGSDLVAYYRFDEIEDLGIGGDGADDVRDYSATGHHGDIVGGATLDPVPVGVEAQVESTSWGRLKAYFAGS